MRIELHRKINILIDRVIQNDDHKMQEVLIDGLDWAGDRIYALDLAEYLEKYHWRGVITIIGPCDKFNGWSVQFDKKSSAVCFNDGPGRWELDGQGDTMAFAICDAFLRVFDIDYTSEEI